MTKTTRTRKTKPPAETIAPDAAIAPIVFPDPKGKLGALVTLLRAPEGTTIDAMMAATGWQAHSVRGAMSGGLKRKLGFAIDSEKAPAGRIYRIVQDAAA